MAKFINYRNIDFKINSQNFYASQVSLSASASVDAVVLSDGSLLNYAPSSAVVGSLDCEFYLTGSLPSFLNITGTDEAAVNVRFANVNITGAYPKSISFSVEPFEPILISASFDWYGNVKVEDFSEQPVVSRLRKEVPQYVANAYKSYLDKESIFGNSIVSSGPTGPSGPLDSLGDVVSFSYSSSCDRPSFFNVEEVIPFRVAKLNKQCEVNLSSNNLGKLVSINGKNATSTIYLKDFYGTSLNSFPISGVLSNQSYNVSNGQYLLAEASIQQTVTERKTLV
jgi:hypothetical protein